MSRLRSYAPFEKGFVPFGPQNAVIEISTNGTFDIAGNYCYMKYAIVLAGGTLKNSVTQGNVHSDWLSIGNLTLTADSTLLSAAGTHLGANKSDQTFAANLGVHVLDVRITAGDFYDDPLHLLKYAFTNGTVRVSKGGWFRVGAAGDPWKDCTLEYQSGALDFDANLTVENLIQEADTDNTSGWNKRNAGRLFVTGTYKPVADYYHNFTLKSGVTIDLTEHTVPFVIAPAYDLREGSGKSTFEFEANGTFVLRLGKIPPTGTRVIDWSAQQPTGWENLKFIEPTGRCAFLVTAGGVEVRTGFAIRVR